MIVNFWAPPVRGLLGWLLASLIVVVSGIGAFFLLTVRVEERITTGRPVAGVVTKVEKLPISKLRRSERFVVRYTFSGARTATVNNAFADPGFTLGEQVTVFVDPAHPHRVALAGGYASEGLGLLLLPFVVVFGIAGFLKLSFGRIRWWMRNERHAPRDVPVLEIHGQTSAALHYAWDREARRLNAAAREASTRHAGAFRLLLLLGAGAAGRPRVAWFSRRSQRLIVEVPVLVDGADAEAALRDAVMKGLGIAERWRAKHRPTADASAVTAAVIDACTPDDEP